MEPTTFADLGLSAKVLEAVTASGYTIPTPIQAQAIPIALAGRDILGIAQTGTGKTAAFTMPMICRLETGRARARMPRSLILAPTRELAAQVAQSFEKYGKNHKLSVALLIGGVSMDEQTAKLDRGVDVLIATPGRLLDHFQRGRVMLMGVEILVIDEADRMLDMGFIPDIEKICKLLPPKRQTLFFSATMPPEITRLSEQFLTNPERIEVARPATTASTITKRFVFCANGEDWAKREALRDLIRSRENLKNAIVFCNRKRDVAILLKSMLKHGFNAGALHGDMDQSSRMATLDKFRSGEITLLAASDVAARGLDIPDVSHVFNFDVPWQGDDYVHRIGRTGRAGREGFAATLVTLDDVKAIQEIEKITGEPPTWLGEAPSAEDLAEGARRKRRRGKPVSSGRGGHGDRGDRRPGASAGAGRGPRGEGRGEGRGERRVARSDVAAPDATVPPSSGAPERISDGDRPDRDRPDRRPRRSHSRGNGDETGRAPREGRPERSAERTPDRAPDRSLERTGERSADRSVDRGAEPRRHDRASAQAEHPRLPRGEPPHPRAASDERRPPRRRDDSGPRVGFEDNVPAFLRKPVRTPG